jgi:hypothetical protein
MLQEEFHRRYTRTGPSRWDVPPLPAPEQDGDRAVWTKTRETVESTIGKYPAISFGVALFAGIVLGYWIKRR